MFRLSWHFRLICDCEEGAIAGQPFLYMMSNSLWQSNLEYLSRESNRIGFEELYHPSLRVNNVLHDRREKLAFMRACLAETTRYAPAMAVEYFERHSYFSSRARYRWKSAAPIDSHQRMLDEVVQLNQFLMETFQLLMSSINVPRQPAEHRAIAAGDSPCSTCLCICPVVFCDWHFWYEYSVDQRDRIVYLGLFRHLGYHCHLDCGVVLLTTQLRTSKSSTRHN